MPTFKNKLDELLADVALASGTNRNVGIQKVRDYLFKTPIDQLRTEVTQITSQIELQMLQAAGVPGGLQDVFLNQYTKITSR